MAVGAYGAAEIKCFQKHEKRRNLIDCHAPMHHVRLGQVLASNRRPSMVPVMTGLMQQ